MVHSESLWITVILIRESVGKQSSLENGILLIYKYYIKKHAQ